MGNAQPCFRIGVEKPLVTLMHTWGDIFSLSNLIASDEGPIKDLENQHTKIISVDCGQRMAFDNIPPCFGYLGRGVKTRLGCKAAISL